MKKLLAYPLSALYYTFFGLILLVFHPVQWVSLNIFGKNTHRKSVDYLNFYLTRCLLILGTKITFKNDFEIPKNKPLILVSNHQSLNDIPAITWYMRKYKTKFVSKKELGKGIPSVSFNLRHGENALIDRSNPKQAIPTLKTFGQNNEKNNYCAVIFPEGTRSRNGTPKKFSANGLKILVKYTPSAYIVPLTINNSWKFLKHGGFPMEIGVHLKFDVHEPFEAKSVNFEELLEKVESTIKNSVTL